MEMLRQTFFLYKIIFIFLPPSFYFLLTLVQTECYKQQEMHKHELQIANHKKMKYLHENVIFFFKTN